MKFLVSLLATLLVLTVLSGRASAVGSAGPQAWTYDPGPDPKTEMGRELIELNAKIPHFPNLSYELMGEQKFRPAFGPISWRMMLQPNSVKILFIGQDGTHIAEAAGRPATAGFGGRAHDLANYFGVKYSIGFINTYAFTIKGQYGDRNAPLLYTKGNQEMVCFAGESCDDVYLGTFMDNGLWLLSQDQRSPLVQWRNQLIDWIVRNNRDSLKMIVTFGGSARDSISTYIESRGGNVGTRVPEYKVKNFKALAYRLENAGGNNNFPVPVDVHGNDLYWKLFADQFSGTDCEGRTKSGPNYTPPYKDRGCPDDMEAVKDLLRENFVEARRELVVLDGGDDGSGILHAGQLGGYDIDRIQLNGQQTISLKGLTLGDGSKLSNDVLVVDLPHPTFLSMNKKSASSLVGQKLRVLDGHVKQGWRISPDVGYRGPEFAEKKAGFFAGKRYEYGRGDIGPEFYDFGTPANRMVSESHAKRLGRSSILLGARQDYYFDQYRNPNSGAARAIEELETTRPNSYPDEEELYIAISRTKTERYNFDPGPGEEFAKLMKVNLNLPEIFKYKPGMEWGRYEYDNFGERIFIPTDGIRASNVKSHESVGDFGHYRGTFQNPEVVVLADPQGYDDIITARALTGTRGQYLQGLMEDIGVPINHLVFKTVPFAMDGADAEEWRTVLSLTTDYRDKVLAKLLEQGSAKMILTDGDNAASEFKRFLKSHPQFAAIPVINVERSADQASYNRDMIDAGKKIKNLSVFASENVSGQMANIPGAHLSYYARVWEGTSGDRVLTSPEEQEGIAFVEVVPDWVTSQRSRLSDENLRAVQDIKSFLCNKGMPMPGERPADFLMRKVKEDFPSCIGF